MNQLQADLRGLFSVVLSQERRKAQAVSAVTVSGPGESRTTYEQSGTNSAGAETGRATTIDAIGSPAQTPVQTGLQIAASGTQFEMGDLPRPKK